VTRRRLGTAALVPGRQISLEARQPSIELIGAKVGQTAGCSTFTRGATPATRRVADGERMNPPGRGGAYTPIPGDDEHLENCLHPGARRPRTPLSMGSPPLVFYHPAAYAARGRIFPAPARGNPAPRV
jgi:hypothetical protein